MISKQSYRKWIRDRNEELFQYEIDYKHSGKKWRTTQLSIINTFIEEYNASGFYPEYLITRNYWYKQSNRDKVVEHNKRLTNVVMDFIKPTNIKPIFIDHFIEKHKDKQKTIDDDNAKIILVKNTISGNYEDDVEYELIEGTYHTHTIVTGIDDDKIFYPNCKIQSAIENVYGMEIYEHVYNKCISQPTNTVFSVDLENDDKIIYTFCYDFAENPDIYHIWIRE